MLRVMHADDTPHRLALGVALGVLIALTPTVGVQLFLYFPIAWLIRANAIVGIPFLFATNVFTIVPVYMAQYSIGAFVLGRDSLAPDNWKALAADHGNWWDEAQFIWHFTWEHIEPLGIGAFATAVPLALIAYVVMSSVVKAYRMRKFGSCTVPAHHRQAIARPTGGDRA